MDYDDHIYKDNIWNDFVKCYNESGKLDGDYKYSKKINKWTRNSLNYSSSTAIMLINS